MNPTIRVSLGMLMLTLSIVFVAEWLGLVPNAQEFELDNRKKVSELLAVQLTSLVQSGDTRHIRTTLDALVRRDPSIASAALRVVEQGTLFEVGDHSSHWTLDSDEDVSTFDQVVVPIYQEDERWGSVEIRFVEAPFSLSSFIRQNSFFAMLAFLTVTGFVLYYWFMRRVLRHLDPSQVVPERVKAAFNSLAEGVLILDENASIVLANSAFAETSSGDMERLVGRDINALNWSSYRHEAALAKDRLPWQKVIQSGAPIKGARLTIHKDSQIERSFAVNCTPIHDASKGVRGVIVTFDDLTDLEKNNEQLSATLVDLKRAQADITQKNIELEQLATRDPLTNCLNRRALREQSLALFAAARAAQSSLICIMADIDYFKRINDTYGHAVGDKVIRFVADVLRGQLRKSDLLGRYGGEEYCMIIEGVSIEQARSIAERMRKEVTTGDPNAFTSALRVTASFGLSVLDEDVQSCDDLVSLADKALYISKESGRNRVTVWSDESVAGSTHEQPDTEAEAESSVGETAAVEHFIAESDDEATERIRMLEAIAAERAEQIDRYVAYDATTRLPARGLFMDRVEQALLRARREAGVIAVLSLGLVDYNRLSDTLGHEAAQEYLRIATSRIKDTLRASDTVSFLANSPDETTVSALSDGEFGLLLPSVEDPESITWIVRRILQAFGSTVEIQDHQLSIKCHVGISVYPTDAVDASDLIRHASVSRYYAAQQGGANRVEFFSEHINRSSKEQLYLESEMSAAIDSESFEVLYQPKVDLASGQVTGLEALLRWNHPRRGVLAPGEFIEIAERTRLINLIGDWVLRQACLQIDEMSRACGRPLTAAINLSPVQFAQADLPERILSIVADTGVDPGLVELELTESCLLEDMERTFESLAKLQANGIKISIDDFGTGYSGLSYLRSLPIDTLKIDRCFVADVSTRTHDEAIVRAIVSMAKALDLRVIAEGVETRAQLDYLARIGCDEAQGYLFSRPVKMAVARDMILAETSWPLAESA